MEDAEVSLPLVFCRIRTAALSCGYGVPEIMSKVNAPPVFQSWNDAWGAGDVPAVHVNDDAVLSNQ